MYLVDFAKAALELSSLRILVLDTTGVDKNADIIGAYLLDGVGKIRYHQLFRPLRHETSNFAYTGIEHSRLLKAPTLAEEWECLREALKDCYVLMYNQEFVQERLDENAQYYQLPRFYIIGECLLHAAGEYFSVTHLKLRDACRRIGYSQPILLAAERAQAQLALLQAMAEGRALPTGPRIIRFDEEEEDDESDETLRLDGHPF